MEATVLGQEVTVFVDFPRIQWETQWCNGKLPGFVAKMQHWGTQIINAPSLGGDYSST